MARFETRQTSLTQNLSTFAVLTFILHEQSPSNALNWFGFGFVGINAEVR